MDEQFNFFADVDPQYIFAYMDALALGEEPKFGENSRDPFFVAYNFLKNELARCKDTQEEFGRSLEQSRLENKACKDFQLARQTLQNSAKDSDLTATVVQANTEFDWLVRKFHASISFGLFAESHSDRKDFCKFLSTATGLRLTKDGARLKKIIWLQYLAALNVEDMGEIFNALSPLKQLASQLPPVLADWFALTWRLETYYRQVTRFLDQFDQFANKELADYISQTGTSACGEWLACIKEGETIGKKLRQRAIDMQALYAFVMAGLADPGLRVTNELFSPKSGLARLIANTRG